MEAAYDKLMDSNLNNTKGLTEFLEKSGLVESNVDLKGMFSDVNDPKDVDYEGFQSVLHKIAKEGKYGVEEMNRRLAGQAAEFAAENLDEKSNDSEEEKDDD